jgi:hypothetical protein
MKQNAGKGASRQLRARGTHPALVGVTLPTTPVTTPQLRNDTPQPAAKKQPARGAIWKLIALGLLLSLLSLALYPLLAGAIPNHAVAKRALPGLFPWLTHLFWTAWPPATRAINHLPLFSLNTSAGFANLLLVGLALAFVLLLIAAQVGRKVARERLAHRDANKLLWTILLLTTLLSVIFLFAPAVVWPQVFLYGLYGRMVTVFHVNPYAPSHPILPGNLLYSVITARQVGPAPYGPLWLDLTLPVTLLARDSIANVLFDFRLFGLLVHLANTLLLWQILGRLRAERRVAGTLLYAWNPIILLLGIAEMHYELVVILCVLLASYFYLRRAFLLGWVCVLLAALMNPLCLLLLPLFFPVLWKETRGMQGPQRALWWLLLIGLSLIIAGLAYYPYWPGQGTAIITTQLRQAFFPDTAINSLDAAIQHLQLNAHATAWIAAPLTWNILTAIVAGSLVLLGIWLIDNLELALLFAGWATLAIFALSPQYWPWGVLLPLTLAICSSSGRTVLLAFLLTAGAALSYFFWLGQDVWAGQALVTIGLPLVIWGWGFFFTSTWRMTRGSNSEQVPAVKTGGGRRLSRPSWPGRPTWPGRRER